MSCLVVGGGGVAVIFASGPSNTFFFFLVANWSILETRGLEPAVAVMGSRGHLPNSSHEVSFAS